MAPHRRTDSSATHLPGQERPGPVRGRFRAACVRGAPANGPNRTMGPALGEGSAAERGSGCRRWTIGAGLSAVVDEPITDAALGQDVDGVGRGLLQLLGRV